MKDSTRNIVLYFVVVLIIIAIFVILKPGEDVNAELGLVNSNQDFIEARVGDIAPDFRLETLNGKILSLSDLRGKPVMVNFWATWCPFCVDEMPDMQLVYEERRKDGFEILAINRAESIDRVNSFLENDLNGELEYTILLDRNDNVAKAYIPFGMPVSYFIDRDGRIVNRKMGQLTLDEIRSNVQAII